MRTQTQDKILIQRLAKALENATRYIEVNNAYQGKSLTPSQVEEAVLKNRNVAVVQIAANSVCTLATFNIHAAKALIEEAKR